MKKIASIYMIVFLTILMLTGCGGASKNSAAPAAIAYDYKMEAVEETAAAYASDSIRTEETKVTSGALGSTNTIAQPIDTNRKLIRTVHLNVETDDFETLMNQLNDHISTLGGYIEQSDISGNSMQNNYSRRRAYMTVRIPSNSLDQFISSVEADGNVTNKSETTTDVTIQYSDLVSRKKSLTIEQDRIWALLEKADTLEAVIALEERLSEIRYELESMESRLRLYDNQVEYSTVYVNVEEVKIYTPTAPMTVGERITKGFAENVDNMKIFAADLVVLILATIPIWFPVLFIAVVIFFIIKRKFVSRNIKKNLMSFTTHKDNESHSDTDNQ